MLGTQRMDLRETPPACRSGACVSAGAPTAVTPRTLRDRGICGKEGTRVRLCAQSTMESTQRSALTPELCGRAVEVILQLLGVERAPEDRRKCAGTPGGRPTQELDRQAVTFFTLPAPLCSSWTSIGYVSEVARGHGT